jgi:hypothetical protein
LTRSRRMQGSGLLPVGADLFYHQARTFRFGFFFSIFLGFPTSDFYFVVLVGSC